MRLIFGIVCPRMRRQSAHKGIHDAVYAFKLRLRKGRIVGESLPQGLAERVRALQILKYNNATSVPQFANHEQLPALLCLPNKQETCAVNACSTRCIVVLAGVDELLIARPDQAANKPCPGLA